MNVPKLRFKDDNENDFPEWEIKTLGEIGEFFRGHSYTSNNVKEQGILVLRSSNIKNHILDYKNDLQFVDKECNDNINLIKNDIVICMSNGSKNLVGKSGFYDGNYKGKITVGAFCSIFRSKNVLSRYLFQLNYYTNALKILLEGTVINNLKNNQLAFLSFLIPTSLEEQQKIGNFFATIDKKISQLQEKKRLLALYKKGIMQKIFSQELRFKDDNGNYFADWEEKSLGEVCTNKSSNISANTLKDNEGIYKIYGASGLLKKIDFYKQENEYISIVKDGAGVGRVLLCEEKSSVLGTLNVIEAKSNAYLRFVYVILQRIDFEKYIVGSVIPHIYFKDYSKIKIPLPCLEEQTLIGNFLSAIDKKIAHNDKELALMKEYKKGLLQEMFI